MNSSREFDVGLTKYWYQDSLRVINILLLPISWVFGAIVSARRALYRIKLLTTYTFDVPVIIVGNITVGGTGKTPFVIWLASFLTSQGFRPGIISRGVGGKKHLFPRWVGMADLPAEVGDEAILLARHTGCPLVICTDKVKAMRAMLARETCNVIISDDGLQHYRLGRQVEIALIDGLRRFGNQCLLPAGPLREPMSRLASTDLIVVNEGEANEWCLTLLPIELVSVKNPHITKDLSIFSHHQVHAVAAIGNPQRFFNSLKQAGMQVIPHVFPDHYLFGKEELNFTDDLPIIMTEKDAVKWHEFADDRCWYVRIIAKMSAEFSQQLIHTLKSKGVTNAYVQKNT